MKRRVMPVGHSIGIGAMLEQKLDALVVVPVGLAQQHRRKAIAGELAALHEDLEGSIVVTFRRMICHLAIVRVRAALEQQASELRIVSYSSGAVQGALKLRLG